MTLPCPPRGTLWSNPDESRGIAGFLIIVLSPILIGMIKRTSHSWVHKHRISLGVVTFILIACITFLFLATSAANRNIEANTNKTAELNARYDKLIPELEAKREARE